MIVAAIKTERVTAKTGSLTELLDRSLNSFEDHSILVITSKVVSLCEGTVLAHGAISKEDLIVREADWYLPTKLSKYGHHFTITNNTLIPTSGIDESNGDGQYVLWPKDPQASANNIRVYMQKRFGIKDVGIIITDSTCHPLRRGTTGIMLAHSGFAALHNYVGQPDLFGRPFTVSQSDVAGGLAAAAVVVMGEGTEQTPLAILGDLPFVQFQDREPSVEELTELRITMEEDLFAPFLQAVPWQRGQRS